MTSHFNMIANLGMVQTIEKGQITARDVFICVLPLYHMYGLGVVMPIAHIHKIPLVIVEKFDLQLFLHSIQTFHVSLCHIVPPMALALAKHPMVDKYNLSSISCFVSAAAPLGIQLCEEIYSRIKKPIKQGYGMFV